MRHGALPEQGRQNRGQGDPPSPPYFADTLTLIQLGRGQIMPTTILIKTSLLCCYFISAKFDVNKTKFGIHCLIW